MHNFFIIYVNEIEYCISVVSHYFLIRGTIIIRMMSMVQQCLRVIPLYGAGRLANYITCGNCN